MKKKNIRHINILRQYRKQKKYTQKDVADILGMKNVISISRWENGIVRPSMTNIFKLSILYQTLPEVLFLEVVKELRDEVSKGVEEQKLKAKSNR